MDMSRGTEIDKGKGIRAGLICFAAFLIPWFLWAFLFYSVAPEGFQGDDLVAFLIGVVFFAFVSAFLGFSIARKSKLLKVLSYLLVAAVPITWVILFVYYNFIE
jgi:hypothetical protein